MFAYSADIRIELNDVMEVPGGQVKRATMRTATARIANQHLPDNATRTQDLPGTQYREISHSGRNARALGVAGKN